MRKRRLEDVKSAVSEMFELPKDIVLNLPRISIIGKNQMIVENHKGIIEYTTGRIRVNSTAGVVRIQGDNLNLKNIAAEDIMITGGIKEITFI
jgi:sporulation protein YqfC